MFNELEKVDNPSEEESLPALKALEIASTHFVLGRSPRAIWEGHIYGDLRGRMFLGNRKFCNGRCVSTNVGYAGGYTRIQLMRKLVVLLANDRASLSGGLENYWKLLSILGDS